MHYTPGPEPALPLRPALGRLGMIVVGAIVLIAILESLKVYR